MPGTALTFLFLTFLLPFTTHSYAAISSLSLIDHLTPATALLIAHPLETYSRQLLCDSVSERISNTSELSKWTQA